MIPVAAAAVATVKVVETVKVVKSIPWLRIIALMILIPYVLWTYWIVPKIDAATPWEGLAPDPTPWEGMVPNLTPWDSLAPWEGMVPGAYGCPTPAPVREASGFPALFHDLGTGIRSVASGPPSASQIKGWFQEAGENTAMAVHFVSNGLEGKPRPIGLAPAPPASVPMTVGSLDGPQIAALATQAGWPAAEIPNVVARVMAESTGKPTARDYADGTHWGLLQLGAAERARYIPGQDAFDPLVNLKGAKLLWDERGWQPWAASDDAVVVSAAQVAPMCAPSSGTMQASFRDFTNGQIPAAALAPVSGGGLLQPSAAAAYEQLNMSYVRAFRQHMSITSSYRDRAGQEACTRAKGSMCAKPGTSNHGWGLALDLGGGINKFGTTQHEWMRANAPQHGWVLPGWAQQGGSKPEPWHWEYIGVGAQQAG